MDYEIAAFIEPLSCVIYGTRRLSIRSGSNALIYGARPIGLLMLQAVIHGGAGAVAVVDLQRDKLELAHELGASEGVLPGDSADDTLRQLAPLGFDVCRRLHGGTGGRRAHVHSCSEQREVALLRSQPV